MSQPDEDLLSILWAVEKLGNMGQTHVIFELSSQKAVEAMTNPSRYRDKGELISQIQYLLTKITDWRFIFSLESSNIPAQRIAQSITEDQRIQSYIVCGAPSWLQME